MPRTPDTTPLHHTTCHCSAPRYVTEYHTPLHTAPQPFVHNIRLPHPTPHTLRHAPVHRTSYHHTPHHSTPHHATPHHCPHRLHCAPYTVRTHPFDCTSYHCLVPHYTAPHYILHIRTELYAPPALYVISLPYTTQITPRPVHITPHLLCTSYHCLTPHRLHHAPYTLRHTSFVRHITALHHTTQHHTDYTTPRTHYATPF